jgi:DNA-binding transcriptional LysR family regulator
MPHLVGFQRHQPLTAINLCCAMESADVLRLEADMAVQFTRPSRPGLKVVKLGRLHVHAFASQDYLDSYGTPNSTSDLANHKFVQQVAPQLDDSILAGLFNLDHISNLVSFRTNTSTAHFYAIEKGAGIGVLPTFAVALKAPVVPLDIARPHHLDIWLTFHPDIKKIPRKAQVISWLRRIFDPRIYPWFRDEFIHPDILAKELPASASINLGDGYYSVNPGNL